MQPQPVFLTALVLSAVQVAFTGQALAQNIDYPQTRNFIEANKAHPITYELLEVKARAVKTLRHVLKMDRPFHLYDDRFCATEKNTALSFGELTYGLSPAQIKKLIGAPDYKELVSARTFSSPANSQDWLYILGRTPILMRFIFDRDKCIQLSVQPYDLDGLYCSWRKKDLIAYATGKTRLQILQTQGPPREACDLSMPPGLANSGQIDFWLNALKTEKLWTYQCGDLNDVTLTFKDDVCRGQVNPEGLPADYTEERTHGATFKMPGSKAAHDKAPRQ